MHSTSTILDTVILQHFQIGDEDDRSHNSDLKHYINWDLDTIWFMQGAACLPQSVHFFYGICHEPRRLDMWSDQLVDEPHECGHQFELERLVIMLKFWKEPSHLNYERGYFEDPSYTACPLK
jgi:hypothetical protein